MWHANTINEVPPSRWPAQNCPKGHFCKGGKIFIFFNRGPKSQHCQS